MACESTNITETELQRAIKNGAPLFELEPNQTRETSLKFGDAIQNTMQISEEEYKDKPNRYTFLGQTIKERVSDKAKALFKSTVGKGKAHMLSNTSDSGVTRDGGNRVHGMLEELVEYTANNKGNINDIRIRALKDDYAVSTVQFNILNKTAKGIVKQIEDLQKEIDPSQKAIIKTEYKILDSVRSIGGTIDVFAVFSDNTAVIYDYKTLSSGSKFNGKNLTDSIVYPKKEQGFELTMEEYKRQVIEVLGIKEVRQTRIIPIHIKYEALPKELQDEGKYLSKKIRILQAGADMSEFLEQIPVAGEKTKYAGINQLLERQWSLFSNFQRRLDQEKLTTKERDRLKERAAMLKKSINGLIIKTDIKFLLDNMDRVTLELASFNQPKLLTNGKNNPKYLNHRLLGDLLIEGEMYSKVLEFSASYFKDLRTENPESYTALRDAISDRTTKIIGAVALAKIERDSRLRELIDNDYKEINAQGQEIVSPMDELGFFESNFSRFSEIKNPIFEAAWPLIQQAHRLKRKDVATMNDEISLKTKALHKWADSQDISRQKAFDRIINFETGNLYGVLDSEFYEIRDKFLYNTTDRVEAIKGIKSLYEIIDKVAYKKAFDERADNMLEVMKGEYVDNPKLLNKVFKQWVDKNNLLSETSNDAWLNSYNFYSLQVKPDIKKQYTSKEYNEIKKHKPLLDYYEMYVKYNKEFREILGISNYSRLPDNFIANVRKEMSDYIVNSDGNIGRKFTDSIKEFIDSFRIREEDIYIADRDNSGELHRTIPIFFTQPLKNKDGDIDNTKKSYDLSHSLILFGNMTYNYKHMHEVEPKILGLKEMLGNPSVEHAGIQVTDSYGRKIKGRINKWAVKTGTSIPTYQLFEDLTDCYLYGIKFKKTELKSTGKFNSIKALRKLKQWSSVVTLAFAVIPAAGAWIAGRTGVMTEGSKEIAYRNKDFFDAKKLMFSDFNKYRSFAAFFETYAENPIERMSQKRTINWLKRWSDSRTLFAPLRKVDENIHNNIAAAMAHNWGIDPKTKKLVRLNRKKLNTETGKLEEIGTTIKSLVETSNFDKKTGKFTVDNLTDENYMEFRDAVRQSAANIIGSLSEDDISRVDTNLTLNLIMQYKTWMPDIVKERTGTLRWDKKLQAVKWGRYKVLSSEFKRTEREMEDDMKLSNFISSVVLPNLGGLILDVATFGLAPLLGRTRVNEARAQAQFKKWMVENPNLAKRGVTFDDFLEVKQGQMKAVIREMRIIFALLATTIVLGGKGDDDEPRYMENWLTRNLYKALTKGQSELIFMWNPREFWKLVQNPLPLTFFLQTAFHALANGLDEGRDWVFGENNPQDKTNGGYYILQMGPGGTQILRIIELYPQFKTSPYAVKW